MPASSNSVPQNRLCLLLNHFLAISRPASALEFRASPGCGRRSTVFNECFSVIITRLLPCSLWWPKGYHADTRVCSKIFQFSRIQEGETEEIHRETHIAHRHCTASPVQCRPATSLLVMLLDGQQLEHIACQTGQPAATCTYRSACNPLSNKAICTLMQCRPLTIRMAIIANLKVFDLFY